MVPASMLISFTHETPEPIIREVDSLDSCSQTVSSCFVNDQHGLSAASGSAHGQPQQV